MKEGYPIVIRMTQADIDDGKADSVVGARIEVIDSVGGPTGVVYESGAVGSPTLLVTGSNINTVMQSAGGAGWEKVQITTASYALKPSTSGASRDFHIESGGSLAALVVADWPIPASPKVDTFKIRNFSGAVVIFTITVGANQYAGIVTHDDDSTTPAATTYSIRNDGMVVVSIDSDGWVQVVPSAEVSQAEFDAGLAGKSGTAHSHTGTYEPANANIQNHVTAAHAPSTAEQNVQSDWNAASGDEQILNKPTINNISVKVTRSTVQSLSSGGTIVSWDTVDHEVGATTLWDVANPTRLTAPVAGTYLIVVDIAAESDSIGQITILKNGTAVHNGTAPRFWTGSGSTSALVRLAVGDYIECRVTPAATVNSIVAAERHYLAMVFVSL